MSNVGTARNGWWLVANHVMNRVEVVMLKVVLIQEVALSHQKVTLRYMVNMMVVDLLFHLIDEENTIYIRKRK